MTPEERAREIVDRLWNRQLKDNWLTEQIATAIRDGEAESQRWIPVSERLPPLREYVWVYTRKGYQYASWLTPDGWMTAVSDSLFPVEAVSHWRPLPSPPPPEDL